MTFEGVELRTRIEDRKQDKESSWLLILQSWPQCPSSKRWMHSLLLNPVPSFTQVKTNRSTHYLATVRSRGSFEVPILIIANIPIERTTMAIRPKTRGREKASEMADRATNTDELRAKTADIAKEWSESRLTTSVFFKVRWGEDFSIKAECSKQKSKVEGRLQCLYNLPAKHE